MPATVSKDSDDGRIELSDRTIRIATTVHAVAMVGALSVVGLVVLDDVVYGITNGLFLGISAWWFIPWLLKGVRTNSDGGFTATVQRIDESTGLGVFGIGLQTGGLLMLLVALSTGEPNIVIGTAVAVSHAVLAYVAGSFVFDY